MCIRDSTHEDYPEAMRWLAAKENVPLIDLNEMTRTLYEAMGVEPLDDVVGTAVTIGDDFDKVLNMAVIDAACNKGVFTEYDICLLYTS